VSGIAVRLASPADAEAIAGVHIASWDWAYRGLIDDAYLDAFVANRAGRTERWQTILGAAGDDEQLWVAERDGVIVGFCGTRRSDDNDATAGTADVSALYLHPDAAGLGIGRALFAHAVGDLHSRGFGPLTLWVLRSNARGRRFYEAAGWRPDGAEKVEERPGASLDEVRYRAPDPN
jgi:ribosomal protein S18 acetylase RimI-like enzyme